MNGQGYRSPLTAGGLVGCVVTLPFLFLALMLFDDAIHSPMPWWHWPLYFAAVIAVPPAIIAAVKWLVDRFVAPRR